VDSARGEKPAQDPPLPIFFSVVSFFYFAVLKILNKTKVSEAKLFEKFWLE
jgi:hypothetical protein